MTYITPHKVFSHLPRLAAWQEGRVAPPVTLEWDLSNRCSLGCQDCHFAHTHTRGPWVSRSRMLPMAYEGTGDLADVELVERGLREAAQAGVEGVVWSGGGEPTLNPHWAEIVAYGASQGLQQGMYTLGGHLTAETAGFLADTASWVVVSLDACTAETYAAEKGVSASRFTDACNGVRMLAGRKAVVGVSFLLHEANWREAPEMLRLSRSLGATYATFRPAIRTSPDRPGVVAREHQLWILGALDVLSDLESQPDVEMSLSRFGAYWQWQGHGYDTCYGVRLSATVTPDGRVWICPQRRGVSGSCLGDLRAESFGELWKRHPGHYAVDDGCRAMCRLHQTNQVLADVYAPRAHAAFV